MASAGRAPPSLLSGRLKQEGPTQLWRQPWTPSEARAHLEGTAGSSAVVYGPFSPAVQCSVCGRGPARTAYWHSEFGGLLSTARSTSCGSSLCAARVQVDRAATELPEGLGRAVREAITRQEVEFDIYATAGTFTSLEECVPRQSRNPPLFLDTLGAASCRQISDAAINFLLEASLTPPAGLCPKASPLAPPAGPRTLNCSADSPHCPTPLCSAVSWTRLRRTRRRLSRSASPWAAASPWPPSRTSWIPSAAASASMVRHAAQM